MEDSSKAKNVKKSCKDIKFANIKIEPIEHHSEFLTISSDIHIKNDIKESINELTTKIEIPNLENENSCDSLNVKYPIAESGDEVEQTEQDEDLLIFKNKNEIEQSQLSFQGEVEDEECICEFCQMESAKKSNFAEHCQGEDQYTCEVCNKSFTNKELLIVHSCGSQECECEFCQMETANQSNSFPHMELPPEDLYTCEVCNETYSKEEILMKHKRIHGKQFFCKICNDSFKSQKVLSAHMCIHTEKIFTCEICDKSFLWSSNFNIHIRSHSEESSYSCDICDKSFAHKSNLTKHNHTKHKSYSCNE